MWIALICISFGSQHGIQLAIKVVIPNTPPQARCCPRSLQSFSNCWQERGLVKISASMFSIGQYLSFMSLWAIWSQMKLYWMSMCLVQVWYVSYPGILAKSNSDDLQSCIATSLYAREVSLIYFTNIDNCKYPCILQFLYSGCCNSEYNKFLVLHRYLRFFMDFVC